MCAWCPELYGQYGVAYDEDRLTLDHHVFIEVVTDIVFVLRFFQRCFGLMPRQDFIDGSFDSLKRRCEQRCKMWWQLRSG